MEFRGSANFAMKDSREGKPSLRTFTGHFQGNTYTILAQAIAFLLLKEYHACSFIKSSKESSALSIIQVVFSPNGCTPEVSATTSDGPVAVFSP